MIAYEYFLGWALPPICVIFLPVLRFFILYLLFYFFFCFLHLYLRWKFRYHTSSLYTSGNKIQTSRCFLETKQRHKPEWEIKLKVYHLSSGNKFEIMLRYKLAGFSFSVKECVVEGRDADKSLLYWQRASKLSIILEATL